MSEISGNNQLGINMLKAECYLYLGREHRAAKAITSVCNILKNPNVDSALLKTFAESVSSPTSFIQPLIMYKVASDIITNSGLSPDDTVDGISKCIRLCKEMLQEVNATASSDLSDILKSDSANAAGMLEKALKPVESSRVRVIILDFGVDYMLEMLKDLRAVQRADVEAKALKEAWSMTHIAYVMAHVREFGKSYKLRKEGIEVMDRVFGARAKDHYVYGVILHNMGIVLGNSGKMIEAKELYTRALEAKENAKDWSGIKELDIEQTRKALERLKKTGVF